jgi:hypothetical protein
MAKAKADPYAGAVLVNPSEAPAPRAELVERPDISTVQPDLDKHDPTTYAGLTTDHALRTTHAQGAVMDSTEYFKIFDKALEDANNYRAKQAELRPGGLEEQKAALAAKSALIQKQIEQGPSATAEALRRGAFPGQKDGGVTGTIKAPSEQQQKDWASYTEGFHTLQDMHILFDKMATKTVGAGGPAQSLAGATTKLIDLTSPEARVFHSYKESSLIPVAKSVFGDAATTAGRENVQNAMSDALPGPADTLQTGGQKMYTYYKRALDKLETERKMAHDNDINTVSIDGTINDFREFLNRPDVKKYDPTQAQPLVASGTSAQTQAAQDTQAAINTRNAALAGTNPPATQQPQTAPQAAPAYTAPPDYGAPVSQQGRPFAGLQASGSEQSAPNLLAEQALTRLGETWSSGEKEVSAAPPAIPYSYSDYGGQ